MLSFDSQFAFELLRIGLSATLSQGSMMFICGVRMLLSEKKLEKSRTPQTKT